MVPHVTMLRIKKSIIGVLCIMLSELHFPFAKNRYPIFTMMHIPKKPGSKYLSSYEPDATFLGTLSCAIMQTHVHFADSPDDGYAYSLLLLTTHLCDFLTLLPPPLGRGPTAGNPAVGPAHMHEYHSQSYYFILFGMLHMFYS